MSNMEKHDERRTRVSVSTKDSTERVGNFFENKNNFQRPASNMAPLHTTPVSDKDSSSRAEKMLGWILEFSILAIFFGLPIFFLGFTLQGVNFDKQIYFYFWMLIALVAWVSRGVLSGELKLYKTPLDLPMIIFWVSYAVATAFSIDRWHSFWGFFGDPSRGLMNITALIIFYYLLFSNFNWKLINKILTALIFSGMLVSAWTVLAFQSINFAPEFLMKVAPVSLLGSISALGIFFSMIIPILLLAILKIVSSNLSSVVKPLLIIVLVVNLIANLFILLSIYSYVLWPAILVGLGFFLMFILSRVIQIKENWSWLPMAVFVAVLVFLFIGMNVNRSANGRNFIVRRDLPVEVTPLQSLSWQVAKGSLGEKAITGSGPATYGYAFSKFHPKDFNLLPLYNSRFYQATGIFWESLSTIGLLGTVAMLLVITAYLSVVVYLLTREKEKNKLYSLSLISSTLILLISSFMTKIEASTLILGTLVASLALCVLLHESESEEKSVSLSLKASPKFALALAFMFMVVSAGVVFIFVFIGKIAAADIYAGLAIKNSATEEQFSEKFGKAINLYPNEGRYFSLLGQQYLLMANNEFLKKEGERNVDKIKGYLNSSIIAANRGKDLMKNDVFAHEMFAQANENGILYTATYLAPTEEAYKKAMELEPYNPDYALKLGQIKLNMIAAAKDVDEKKALASTAKELFNDAINKKSNFAAGYYNLSIAQEILGDIDQAISSMQQATKYAGQEKFAYYYRLGVLHQGKGDELSLKMAETMFGELKQINDKDVNARFSLGRVYELQKKKTEAIEEYGKVVELLSGNDVIKKRVQKMIENVRNGIANTAESLGLNDTNNAAGGNVPGGELNNNQ